MEKLCVQRRGPDSQSQNKSTWSSLSGEVTDKHITDFKHHTPFPSPCQGPKALPAHTIPVQPPGALPTLPTAQDPVSGRGAASPCPSVTRSPQPFPPQPICRPTSCPVPSPSPGRCLMLGAATWLGWWDGLGCRVLPKWGLQNSWCPGSPSPHHTPDVCAFMSLVSEKKKRLIKLGYTGG